MTLDLVNIRPSCWLANANPVSSTIGKASISVRQPIVFSGAEPFKKTRMPVRQVRCSTKPFPAVISAIRSKR